jgi:hypothetical protein
MQRQPWVRVNDLSDGRLRRPPGARRISPRVQHLHDGPDHAREGRRQPAVGLRAVLEVRNRSRQIGDDSRTNATAKRISLWEALADVPGSGPVRHSPLCRRSSRTAGSCPAHAASRGPPVKCRRSPLPAACNSRRCGRAYRPRRSSHSIRRSRGARSGCPRTRRRGNRSRRRRRSLLG